MIKSTEAFVRNEKERHETKIGYVDVKTSVFNSYQVDKNIWCVYYVKLSELNYHTRVLYGG